MFVRRRILYQTNQHSLLHGGGVEFHQLHQLVIGHLRDELLAAVCEERVGERLLVLDHRVDLLLQGARRHELVDQHVPFLPDAVGAVARLVLHRRIPPAVEMHHMVRGGEAQTREIGGRGELGEGEEYLQLGCLLGD